MRISDGSSAVFSADLNFASAIVAEMAVTAEMTCARLAQAAAGPEGRSTGAMAMMLAPEPVVWPRLADRIGLLDADLARDTVRCWMLLPWHAQLRAANDDDIKTGYGKDEVAQYRSEERRVGKE